MSDVAGALVIFGITGDLARKKTFAALYDLDRHGDCLLYTSDAADE